MTLSMATRLAKAAMAAAMATLARRREIMRRYLPSPSPGLLFQRLRRCEHCGGVAGDADLAPGLRNLSGLVDQERAALHAHILPSIHRFFHPGAVFVGHRMALVGC